MLTFACFRHVLHQRLSPSDLLLLFWPVFFVSASRHGPQLKSRNFRKSVERGAAHARKATSTTVVALARPVQRKRQFPPSEGLEEKPAWDTASTTSRQRKVRFLRPRNKFKPEVDLMYLAHAGYACTTVKTGRYCKFLSVPHFSNSNTLTWYAGTHGESCCACVSPLATSVNGGFEAHKNQPT